jgi:predicted TIM-barrel fold metal-dependent hydrolase
MDAPLALVDTHAHVYLSRMPLSTSAWHRPPRDATFQEYAGTLARHHVRHAVLAAASLYGEYSDYTLAALDEFPHWRATVIVQPGVDAGMLRDMKARGVVGIRLQWRTLATIPDLRSADYQGLLRQVADLDWHVHVHDDAPRLATYLRHLEAAGIRLVIDHFGRPDPARGLECAGFQALLRAVQRGRTWVKLSAAYRLESRTAACAYARELLHCAGPERLFWGSDWPFAAFEDRVTYDQVISEFEACVPDPRARQRISDNALAFYYGKTNHVL